MTRRPNGSQLCAEAKAIPAGYTIMVENNRHLRAQAAARAMAAAVEICRLDMVTGLIGATVIPLRRMC
jgi:hypothetical protein